MEKRLDINNKTSIYIIYSNFLDDEGQKHVIGGIQQYIFGLINVFHKDFSIKVIQKAKTSFYKKFDEYDVYAFDVSKNKIAKELYYKIKDEINPSDYIIWASDRISAKINHKNTISIQHGITFDFLDYKSIRLGNLIKSSLALSILYRLFQYGSAITYFLKTPQVVCVDYNFLNWIRTILPRTITDRAVVIPNFSKIPNAYNKTRENKNISILLYV